ncbi:MAG: hypothetical protein NTY05_03265 [Rhodocyclales bacterium]|nr:hypothetical protein [Rhodocyclales bacterium]
MAEAGRSERAAVGLANAAAARAEKEEELARLAGQRAEAERRAAELANETLRAEQRAEAAALSRLAAEEAVAAEAQRRAELEAAAARAVAACEVARSSAASLEAGRLEAEKDKASSNQSPARVWRRLAAGTALALMAGIGAGIWLGTPPAVSSRLPSGQPDTLRLRLDDTLKNPPAQEPRLIPRDGPPSR